MRPKLLLLLTVLGFPVVALVPYGAYLVPAFWTIWGIIAVIYEERSKIVNYSPKKASNVKSNINVQAIGLMRP